MSKRRKLLIAVFWIYIFIVLWLTLIDRQWGERRAMFTPFWKLRELITTNRKLYWTADRVQYPYADAYGVLLPCLHQKFRKLRIIFLTAIMFSAAIEITQYFAGRGLCEFDDVFNRLCEKNLCKFKNCDKVIYWSD